MAVIQTMGLSKRCKNSRAVDHLDLRVEQGGYLRLHWLEQCGQVYHAEAPVQLGPSYPGGGPERRETIRDPVARRRVGVLIEQPGLYPGLSGRENLRLYAALLSPERQVAEILETVGLPLLRHPHSPGRGYGLFAAAGGSRTGRRNMRAL